MSSPAERLLEALELEEHASARDRPMGDFPAVFLDEGEVGGLVTIGDLGDYMDEVHRTVMGLHADVQADVQRLGVLGQSEQGRWTSYVYHDPYELAAPGERGARGWASFYARERGLWARAFEVTELWAGVEAFEAELVRFWDEFAELGMAMQTARPKQGYDSSTTSDTVTDLLKGGLTLATILGVVWGIGQLRRPR